MRCRRLGVPIGTRLEMITQHSGGAWRIWTGIANKGLPPEQYQGSYIELHSDGSAFYIPNDFECIEVMDANAQRTNGNAMEEERS